jgi:hypothetical protein
VKMPTLIELVSLEQDEHEIRLRAGSHVLAITSYGVGRVALCEELATALGEVFEHWEGCEFSEGALYEFAEEIRQAVHRVVERQS